MKWINANDLERWADKIPARTSFPALIADLVRASSKNITDIRFPNGDKGQIRGFDGELISLTEAFFVPEGASIWEFGVTKDFKAKAKGDFDKRTKEVPAELRAKTTFVFATPRTWDNNSNQKWSDWVRDEFSAGGWKDVKFIDGSKLETWLEEHPAVAARWAKYELGLMPQRGARSTDEFWQEFAHRFSPPLVEEVLLAGRDAQVEKLLLLLQESNGRLHLAADSPDEVIAFCVAAIRKAPEQLRYYLEAKTIIIDEEESARQLANKTGLAYLPRGQARPLVGVLSLAGPTVSIAGLEDNRRAHEVLLRPGARDLSTALVKMDFPEDKAYELAQKCGRSIAVLERQIPSGTAVRPEWVKQADALIPALLAGAWSNTSAEDQNILKGFAGCEKYEDFEAPLRKLLLHIDPPIDRIKDVWALRAPVDAFINLAHELGQEHLDRFADAAKKVFSEIVERPTADQIFSLDTQRKSSHSDWLRDGMMNTLLHMSALHEQVEVVAKQGSLKDYVNEVVRDIPGLSSDYRLMASLRNNLSMLAEAAPVPFLDALERLLEGDAEKIKPIFNETAGFITPETHHVGLLWALETLAWDVDYFGRATIALAKLAAIDPGGSVTNRPINSLREIFVAWSPRTRANSQTRKAVLEKVITKVPEISWELLVKLLPRSHDTTSMTAVPKFGESSRAESDVLTFGAVWDFQNFIVSHAIAQAGNDAERWVTLVNGMGHFPLESFEKTREGLTQFLEKQPPDTTQKAWEALRKLVKRHRAHSDTDWAFQEEQLLQLEALVLNFESKYPKVLHAWLFDEWMPDIPEAKGSIDEIEAMRKGALSEIFANGAENALVEFFHAVKQPQLIGTPLIGLELPVEQLEIVLTRFLREGEKFLSLAALLVSDGVRRFGEVWQSKIEIIFKSFQITPIDHARLLMALPDSLETWNYVAKFGIEVEAGYWVNRHAFALNGPYDELMVGIENYIRNGRPFSAIQAAFRRLQEVPTASLVSILDNGVAEINTRGAAGDMTSYYVEKVFEELNKRDDIAIDEIARLEFRYLPFFDHREVTLNLHRLMISNPATYISVIAAIYRKDNEEEPPEPSRETVRLAKAAYQLLKSLHELPGQTNGDIDKQLLFEWTDAVRSLAKDSGLSRVTDSNIGTLLAHSPPSAVDAAWPHEATRGLIEQLDSEVVERAIGLERFNMRGVHSRMFGEGGRQERDLAEKYRTWSKAMAGFPRTERLLEGIAKNWVREAEDADIRAQKDELRR